VKRTSNPGETGVADDTIRDSTAAIVERSRKESIPPRRAAQELATSRVEKAMRLRRY